MFDSLRRALSGAARSLGEKELGAGDVDAALDELEMSLLEADVAAEAVDSLRSGLRARLAGATVDRKAVAGFVRDSLVGEVSALFDGAGAVDLAGRIGACRAEGRPCVVMFVGINGTGKTTTLAKVASMLRASGVSVAVAAADTFRAGAIEQLRAHTGRLGVKIVAQNYGADPAAVARDAVLYARSHRVDCVLVDTAGRMQTSRNLMEQISKIAAVVRPDVKIFVGDSLAGNDTVSQAREFYEHVRFDGSILTKADADARGGAALSIVSTTSTPVMYVGTGQEYGDLEPFSRDAFLDELFGPGTAAGAARPAAAREGAPQPAAPQRDPPEAEPPAAPQPRDTPDAEPRPAPQPAAAPPPDPPDAAPPAAADPFEGIDTGDIREYAELHGAAPPEDDEQARRAAAKVREWVARGRPGGGAKAKKRGLFGGLRR